MENYLELEEYLEKLKIDENYIDYFYNYTRENLRKHPDLAKKVAEEALLICTQKKYEKGCAWALLALGWYYQDRCMYKKAIELHTKSNDIFNQKKILTGMARSSNALLADYTALGIFDLAIEHGLAGIGIAESYGDEKDLIPLIINTAVAYLDSKYYQECMDLIKRLDDLWNKIDNQNRVIIYNILAEAELYFNNLDKAQDYCKKAYELIIEYDLVVIEHDNLLVSAEIKWKIGKYEEAEEDYRRGLDLSVKYKNQIMIQKILISWSKYYTHINKYIEAEKKIIEAITEGSKINSKSCMKEAYYELSMLYEKMERYENAYKAMKKFSEYEKDIFNHNSSLWFAKLHNKKVTDEAKAYKVLYDEMNIISNIGKKITSNLKKESTLESIYKEVNLLVDADIFGIALYNENINSLDYELFIERGEKNSYGLICVEDEDSFGSYCYNNKTDIIINDIYREWSQYIRKNTFQSYHSKESANSAIFCSLMIDDKVIGILSVQNYNKNAYSNNDLNKLKILTSYIAIALQNAKLFEEVEFLATHDSLTGVLNRREILNRGKYNALEGKYGSSTGIIMLDIDHFKKVNDNYGHLIGDYVLVEVVNLIKSQVRSTDYIGRYGGEEFLILLPDTSIEDAKKIGERIRLSIEQNQYKISDTKQINITCSIGIYESPNGNKDLFFDAIKFADTALYKAKELGRNMVVEYLNDILI